MKGNYVHPPANLPDLMVKEVIGGKVVIRNCIPYTVTPHPDAGHVVSIVVNDNHCCPLVRTETVGNALSYIKTFDKKYVLEEVA